MRLIKTLSILPVLIAITYNIKSQQQEFLFNTEFDLNCERVLEDNNGDYVLIGQIYDTSWHYSAYVMKLSENFDTSLRIIENDTADIDFSDFIITPDNKYIVIGSIGKDVGYNILVDNILIMGFDENLNILFENFHLINNDSIYHSPDLKMCQDDEGKIYVAGRGLTYIEPPHYNILLELNENGDILKYNYFSEWGTGEIYAIMKNNGNIDGFYAVGRGFSLYTHAQILEVDTNLNYTITEIDEDWNYYLGFTHRFTAKWLNDSVYLLASSDTPEGEDKDDVVILRMNTEHEIIDEPVWIGRPDTTDDAPRYSMDWKNPDNIFITGHQLYYHVPFETNFIVALIDGDLNVKGMKYYGKDLNFGIYSICATSDGGAILAVGQHDYNDPVYDMDLIVWKIQAEDLITSAIETTNPYDSDYGVFPNPGSDLLYVQTARKGVNMQMFNENGVLISENNFKDTFTNEINTASLPAGVYIYKFTDNEGFTESGKWIKK